MASTLRLTAQGLRDLNYYGPRKVAPVVALAPEPKLDADAAPAELAVELTTPDAVAT